MQHGADATTVAVNTLIVAVIQSTQKQYSALHYRYAVYLLNNKSGSRVQIFY